MNLKSWISILSFCVAMYFTFVDILFAQDAKIPIFVSILPQADFVERIGGERVSVSVLVGPGQNVAVYELTPRQMAALSQTPLYFRIGIHFENAWMKRIAQANPDMKIIDTRLNVPMRVMEAHDHHEGEPEPPQDESEKPWINKDPHIWTSPKLVKIQARTICDALKSYDPAHQEGYEKRYADFAKELDALDEEICSLLTNVRSRNFLVFHPSWGYFADEYGLKQTAIEIEGKEPTARQLAELMQMAKAQQITAIFVQPQFDKRLAATVAQSIGGRVIEIDPLAKDYLANMRDVALKMQKALQ
jgi:zinc transport system substrate-binding protein